MSEFDDLAMDLLEEHPHGAAMQLAIDEACLEAAEAGDRELLPLFRAMNRGFAPVLGAPEARFSLIYVDDLAAAVAAACAFLIGVSSSGVRCPPRRRLSGSATVRIPP